MRPLRAAWRTAAILGLAFAITIGLVLLPENPYQRWRLLDGTIHARAGWIYERTHFDSAPIDVVFLGPSRVGAAVDAPRLEAALADQGLAARVVNFSLPENGRNINAAIMREVAASKSPKLLVIGVTEKPGRFGHSAFRYVAPADMVVWPGFFLPLKYPQDLAYLPFRQARLFGQWMAPGILGPPAAFDPSRYRGSNIDTTGDIVLPDGKIKIASRAADAAELARGVQKLERGSTPPLLPARFADFEFGDERHNVAEIARMARAEGARVAFLFLPYYTGSSEMQEEAFYRRFGLIWNAGWLAPRAEIFADYGHLTTQGADELTDWLVPLVTSELRAEPRP
jgi:hypothetical protein